MMEISTGNRTWVIWWNYYKNKPSCLLLRSETIKRSLTSSRLSMNGLIWSRNWCYLFHHIVVLPHSPHILLKCWCGFLEPFKRNAFLATAIHICKMLPPWTLPIRKMFSVTNTIFTGVFVTHCTFIPQSNIYNNGGLPRQSEWYSSGHVIWKIGPALCRQ